MITLGTGGEFIVSANRLFTTSSSVFIISGTVTVNGTFDIQEGAQTSGGAGTYTYDQTTGTLQTNTVAATTIDSSATF